MSELAETDPDGEARFAPATAPLLELYRGGPLRIGLAYVDTVPSGKTLRIRPAYASFVGLAKGVASAATLPDAGGTPDPTAPGPWTAEKKGPKAARSRRFSDTADNALWASAAGGELWRYDGAWTAALTASRRSTASPRTASTSCSAPTRACSECRAFQTGTSPPQPSRNRTAASCTRSSRPQTAPSWAGTSAGLGRYTAGDKFKTTPLKLEVTALAADSTGAVYDRAAPSASSRRGPTPASGGGSPASRRATRTRSGSPSIPRRRARCRTTRTSSSPRSPPCSGHTTARCGSEPSTASLATSHVARAARSPSGLCSKRSRTSARESSQASSRTSAASSGRAPTAVCSASTAATSSSSRRTGSCSSAAGFVDPAGPAVGRGAWRFRRAAGAWERFDTSLASPAWVAFGGEARTSAEPAVTTLAFTDAPRSRHRRQLDPDRLLRLRLDAGRPGSLRVPRQARRRHARCHRRHTGAAEATARCLRVALSLARAGGCDPAVRPPRVDGRGATPPRGGAGARPGAGPVRASASPSRWTRRANTTRRCSRSRPPRASASHGSRGGRSRCSSGSGGAGRATRSSRRCSTGYSAECARYGPAGVRAVLAFGEESVRKET